MHAKLKSIDLTSLLWLLLVADIALFIIHILNGNGLYERPKHMLEITREGSYAEFYQYLKEFWIVILLVAIGFIKRRYIYFAWSILFLFFLIDDSMSVHEQMGGTIGESLNISNHIGEIIALGAIASLIFLGILFVYFKSTPIEKSISKKLFIYIIFLSIFGVLLDFIHGMFRFGHQVTGFLEDGGEMIVMSLILAYVYSLKLSNTSEVTINEI